MAISEQYLYGVNWSGLKAVDVHDPNQPQFLGACEVGAKASALAIQGHYAYVAAEGLVVVDLSDRAAPRVVGAAYNGISRDVAVCGDYALVADGYAGLRIIDLRDAAHPKLAAEYRPAGEIHRLVVRDQYAYLANLKVGLQIVDISQPTAPREVGECTEIGWALDVPMKLALHGSQVYVLETSNDLEIVDFANPRQPQSVGAIFHARDNILDWPMNITLHGDRAYLPTVRGLTILDLSRSTEPNQVGEYLGIGGQAVSIQGNRAYMAAGWDGLVILDLYPQPPRWESLAQMDEAGCHLFFQGQAGQTVRLQRSPDLNAWQDWQTVVATGARQEVVDPSATLNRQQFYRMIVP